MKTIDWEIDFWWINSENVDLFICCLVTFAIAFHDLFVNAVFVTIIMSMLVSLNSSFFSYKWVFTILSMIFLPANLMTSFRHINKSSCMFNYCIIIIIEEYRTFSIMISSIFMIIHELRLYCLLWYSMNSFDFNFGIDIFSDAKSSQNNVDIHTCKFELFYNKYWTVFKTLRFAIIDLSWVITRFVTSVIFVLISLSKSMLRLAIFYFVMFVIIMFVSGFDSKRQIESHKDLNSALTSKLFSQAF